MRRERQVDCLQCLVLSIDRMEVAREKGSVLCRIALWDCFRDVFAFLLGSLSSNVFERRTSTGSGLFQQVLGQIVSVKVKTPNNTNLVASTHIKREKGSLPVDVRQSKTWLLKRSIST